MIDKTIIEESKKGNLQCFRQLVVLSSPLAFSVAFRMIGSEAEASDIVQESMISVWKSIGKIRSAESYKSWLCRIVVNKCYDQLRKKKRNPEFNADDRTWELIADRISENPSSELESRETAGIISVLTEKLSPKQKAVFILSELEDMSNEEISGITSMSKTSVKANLYHARKRLAELIEKHI